MFKIPLIATPSQSLSVQLGAQNCEITVSQKYEGGVFLTLRADGQDIVTNSLCRNLVSVVRQDYLPFSGELAFVDTQGASDPDYTGFGTRFQLAYVP